MSDGFEKEVYKIPVAIGYELIKEEVIEEKKPAESEETKKGGLTFKVDIPVLEVFENEPLPDLENLTPEQEKALDTKVEKTMEVLG